ncbi:MAG: hypothetical protein HYY90_04005 [Candidatus Omnitrophica bacterium]|nr:hypothetical protein [Candidatus Omnitrophota bacterium]
MLEPILELRLVVRHELLEPLRVLLPQATEALATVLPQLLLRALERFGVGFF